VQGRWHIFVPSQRARPVPPISSDPFCYPFLLGLLPCLTFPLSPGPPPYGGGDPSPPPYRGGYWAPPPTGGGYNPLRLQYPPYRGGTGPPPLRGGVLAETPAPPYRGVLVPPPSGGGYP